MTGTTSHFRDDVSLVLCGEAGSGIQSVEEVTTRLLKRSGRYVFSAKEFMSRVRGGSNSTSIRVSSRPVGAALYRMDILIPFDTAALGHVAGRLTPETVVCADEGVIGKAMPGDMVPIPVPFRKTAADLGNPVYTNMVASGFLAGLFSVAVEDLEGEVSSLFVGPRAALQEVNREAALRGFALARELIGSGKLTVEVARAPEVETAIFITGAEAVGLGALAGGCNFVSSYPMSPSTAVLVFMASHGEALEVMVEQAEDEISAVNMAIGAWYAGARAMVTTSGGGFALMEEAVGLAGMIESPLVIHLAQRPGPATGLPTRTEQGDLNLALYSGHGEFPRIIYAPGTPGESFDLAKKALVLADRYQVPVFILTDQYLLDSSWTIPPPDVDGMPPAQHIVETDPAYKRYRLVADGVSPRGIPGWGTGLVLADSDEHDEEGHITEDHRMRTMMVDKRLAKLRGIVSEALSPELHGPDEYHTLVLCWGSTGPVIREALDRMGWKGTALLHFRQVYPLPPVTTAFLERARRIILVEGNATAQFGRLLRAETGIEATHRILKYDGLAFAVEEVMERLMEIGDGEGEGEP